MADSIVSGLKHHLKVWLNADQKRSINGLAKKIMLGESTVRKAASGESKPSLETVISIMSYITDHETMMKFVECHFPHIHKSMKKVYGKKEHTEVLTSSSIDPSYSETLAHRIYNIAATRVGVTREWISDEYGKEGIRLAEALLNRGVLKEINGRLKTPYQGFAIATSDLAIRDIINQAKCLDPNLIGTKASTIINSTESVNENGLGQIWGELRACSERISDIKLDRSNFGNIPFFASMFMGVYDSSNLKGRSET